jgi:hypothetical protein
MIMATEYMLSYTAAEINEKLGKIDSLVDPVAKTESMTQPVGVDKNGQLWTEPVDVSKQLDTLTLGQHTDGLIYIFIDGKPVGAGINIGTGGGSAEVKIATITIHENFDMPKVGDTLQLAWTISPANVTNKTLAFESSNDSVITVSTDGLVTAIETGSANVTARATDGTDIYCTITIDVLDKSVLDSIPTSYHTAMNTAISGVENEENVHILFADTHFTDTENLRHTFEIINYLAENTNCKSIIGLGDLIDGGGAVEAYNAIADNLKGNRSKLVLIDGNHEWYTNVGSTETVERASNRYKLTTPSNGWVWDTKCGFGYRIDHENSTLIFAMNTYDNIGATVDLGAMPGIGAAVSTKQHVKLMELLCDYPAYKVIVVSHLCLDPSANLSMSAKISTASTFIQPLLKAHGNAVMFAGHLHGSMDGSKAPVPMWVLENDNAGFYDISKHDWSADTVNTWFNNAVPPFTDENGLNQAITVIKVLDDKVVGYGIGKQPNFELNFITNDKTMVCVREVDLNNHSSIGNNITKVVDENNVLSITGAGALVGQWITYKICDVPVGKTYAFAIKYKFIDTSSAFENRGFTNKTTANISQFAHDDYIYQYGTYKNTGNSEVPIKVEFGIAAVPSATVQISDMEYCYADITD